MARSYITSPTDDLISDSGAVLWSFIHGEQLEFPVTLQFVENVTQAGYVFEAKVVEALNVENQAANPTQVRPGGASKDLVIRIPVNRGVWDPLQAYNQEEIVLYNNAYYKLLSGIARVSATTPNADPLWVTTSLSKIYIQFPKDLIETWQVKPQPSYQVYGFFELRVTEPNNSVFKRTWKPVRGMVEIHFSPTFSVED